MNFPIDSHLFYSNVSENMYLIRYVVTNATVGIDWKLDEDIILIDLRVIRSLADVAGAQSSYLTISPDDSPVNELGLFSLYTQNTIAYENYDTLEYNYRRLRVSRGSVIRFWSSVNLGTMQYVLRVERFGNLIQSDLPKEQCPLWKRLFGDCE
jgi:hypothetical protein